MEFRTTGGCAFGFWLSRNKLCLLWIPTFPLPAVTVRLVGCGLIWSSDRNGRNGVFRDRAAALWLWALAAAALSVSRFAVTATVGVNHRPLGAFLVLFVVARWVVVVRVVRRRGPAAVRESNWECVRASSAGKKGEKLEDALVQGYLCFMFYLLWRVIMMLESGHNWGNFNFFFVLLE